MNGNAARPDTELMLTMRPWACLRWGKNAWVTATTPTTFTSRIRRSSASGSSSSGPATGMPALLTSPPRGRPARARSTSAWALAMAAASVTSIVTGVAPSFASPAASCGRRMVPNTTTPRRVSSRAIAAPMPELAPVTSTAPVTRHHPTGWLRATASGYLVPQRRAAARELRALGGRYSRDSLTTRSRPMNRQDFITTLEREWRTKPRWSGITRPYGAGDVYRLRGSIEIEHSLARYGAARFWLLLHDEPYVPVLSAITGNQAIQRADEIHHLRDDHTIHWFAPLVADAEAGFGGPLHAFEIMKKMIAEGAAGVHFEDQLASVKKCGHLGGKVLVPTSEFITKLVAARLAADVCGVETILIARTDANSATLLTSDSDEYDRRFLTGERTAEGLFRVRDGVDAAIARALAYAPYADLLWFETSKPDLAEATQFAH